MTSRDFCYWLQGYFEISSIHHSNNEQTIVTLNSEQVKAIRNHLAMVFKHEIDPSFGDKKHQEELTKAHAGKLPKSLAEALECTKDTKFLMNC